MTRIITQFKGGLLPIIILMMLATQFVFAQVPIKGKVKDETGVGLPGVNVVVKGMTSGTVTDSDGNFSLDVPGPDATLVFSFIGYAPREQKVGSESNLSIQLEPDIQQLKEVVFIGYQTIERELSTSAITTVKAKDIQNNPVPSINLALQGKVAGLTVLASSGEPGAANTVVIRGSSNVSNPSLNSRTYPLYVVDGILFDMNEIGSSATGTDPLSMINPNDIESIDVLKDASASTIYGSRAANGVIVVKTKRPKGTQPQIRLNVYGGVSLKPQMMPVYTGAAERRYKMDLIKDGAPRTTEFYEQMSMFLTDSLNPSFNNNTDWQKLFLQNGAIKNVDFSIAQMGEKSNYRVSFNHYGEEGTLINTGFTRNQATIALGATPTDRLRVDLTLIGSFSDRKRGNGLQDKYPFNPWIFPSSFWQVTEKEVGVYKGTYNDVRDKNTDTYLSANFKTDLRIFDFLHWNINASGFITDARRDFAQASTISGSGTAEAYLDQNQASNWELEHYFSFIKSFKKHNVSAILGSSAKLFQSKHTFFRATNLNSDYYKTIQSVNTKYIDANSNTYISDYSRAGVFARLNYDFDGRYLLSANWRMDGSSRYATGNKWIQFPSISAGWILSKENFWPSAIDVTFFKVRGSYGITGFDPGDPYASYRKLTSYSTGWWQGLEGYGITTYGGKPIMFSDYNSITSGSSLTWQTDPQWNLGFETHLVHDRVNLIVDFYHRESTNLPLMVTLPATTGYSNGGFRNVASVLNQGVEFTLTTSNLPESFPIRWNTNFTLAMNKNMITKLPNGGRTFVAGEPWMQYTLTKGRPIYEYNVWLVDGIYDTNEDVPVNPLTGERMKWYGGPSFSAGDPARRDINGDYNIDDLDKVPMGSPNPKYTGGFNNSFEYKGFTLGVYCYFVYGRKLWNGFFSDKFNGSQRYYSDWGNRSGPASSFNDLSFWTDAESDGTFPSLFTENSVDKYHIANSYFVDNGSFFRLKNVQIGYEIPRTILDKVKLERLKIYGIVENLRVWHHANVPDPEVGDPSGYTRGDNFPLSHKFTIGLDINL